jgi:protein involved in polysaccharide export with SLBB domain
LPRHPAVAYLVLVRSMPRDAEKIDVMVSGAVHTVGRQTLGPPATIRSALDAAGGFAASVPQMKPADTVTVRRPLAGHKTDMFRFSLSEVPAKWEEFALADGDLIVFQWDIQPEET